MFGTPYVLNNYVLERNVTGPHLPSCPLGVGMAALHLCCHPRPRPAVEGLLEADSHHGRVWEENHLLL